MGSPPTAECMRASSCVREGSAKKRRPDDTDGGANMAGLGSVGAATGMVDTRGAVPYARAESAALAEAWPFTAAAVGVGFGGGNITNGMSLATGIGLQNAPEGLAVAVALLFGGVARPAVAVLIEVVEPGAVLIVGVVPGVVHTVR